VIGLWKDNPIFVGRLWHSYRSRDANSNASFPLLTMNMQCL